MTRAAQPDDIERLCVVLVVAMRLADGAAILAAVRADKPAARERIFAGVMGGGLLWELRPEVKLVRVRAEATLPVRVIRSGPMP